MLLTRKARQIREKFYKRSAFIQTFKEINKGSIIHSCKKEYALCSILLANVMQLSLLLLQSSTRLKRCNKIPHSL